MCPMRWFMTSKLKASPNSVAQQLWSKALPIRRRPRRLPALLPWSTSNDSACARLAWPCMHARASISLHVVEISERSVPSPLLQRHPILRHRVLGTRRVSIHGCKQRLVGLHPVKPLRRPPGGTCSCARGALVPAACPRPRPPHTASSPPPTLHCLPLAKLDGSGRQPDNVCGGLVATHQAPTTPCLVRGGVVAWW